MDRKQLELARLQVLEKYTEEKVSNRRELKAYLFALSAEDFLKMKPVCKDHSSPLEFLIDAYFDESGIGFLMIGPRAGYKTKSISLLNSVELIQKDGIELASIGAIEKQTKRGYRFTVRYLNHDLFKSMGLVNKCIMEETTLSNGSRLEMVTATISGVNSPHPNRVRADEFELMKPDILDEMKMMPSSYGGHISGMMYASTHKYLNGNVSDLMENALESDLKIHIWCYKEASERCPDERSGIVPTEYEVEDLRNPGNYIVIQAYDKCKECPLLASCRGDLKRSNGVVKIIDSIKEYRTLDRETWLAQKESKPRKGGGLVYSEFSPVEQVGKYKYNKNMPCDMVIDFGGGTSPTAVKFYQEDEKNRILYAVKEICSTGNTIGYDSSLVLEWCHKNTVRLRWQIGDSAQGQHIIEWNNINRFFKIRGISKTASKKDMIAFVKPWIRDAVGDYRYFVDEDCTNHIREITSYRKRPGSEEPFSKDDHTLDCLAYWVLHKKNQRNPRVRFVSLNQKPDVGTNLKNPKIISSEEAFLRDLWRD